MATPSPLSFSRAGCRFSAMGGRLDYSVNNAGLQFVRSMLVNDIQQARDMYKASVFRAVAAVRAVALGLRPLSRAACATHLFARRHGQDIRGWQVDDGAGFDVVVPDLGGGKL
ncbi:hypothetical protein GGR53DRAFT_528583 [Hypoxylon sp. FL1150]|nr:hypothetical protein GGR53DRAFT_528583 [Hypoxylon sp. FL1150]